MNVMYKCFLTGLCCIILTLQTTSCVSTQLSSVSMDSAYKGRYLKSVMVVGVSNDLKKRQVFEEAFVTQFKKHGVQAVSSAAVTSPDTKISKDVIKGKAEEKGIDTIFVTLLKGIKEETERIPVAITGSGGRTGIYIPGDRYDLPELEVTQTRVTLESRLYEVKTEKMIWSATSEIFDPKSAEGVVQSLSRTITENLQKQKMLK